MRHIAQFSLYTLLIYSLVQIFSVDTALIDFVILGKIPLTGIYLNFWVTCLLIGIAFVILGQWLSTFSAQLTAFKLNDHHKLVAKQAQQVPAAEPEPAQPLEVEDLETISL